MKTVSSFVMLLCLVIGSALPGCTSKDNNANEDIKGAVEGTGTITHFDLEEGFYGIISDDGEHYDPMNLPPEFEEDGLWVKFKGKIRDDLASVLMWGHIPELTSIEKL